VSATRLVGGDSEVAERVAAAPAAYVLTQGSSDIARQCELLTPMPSPWEVRVVATPSPRPDQWHVDVVARDRPGLLASFSGGLAACGLDVVQAVLATWDDGGALQAFLVRAPTAPDSARIQVALEASLGAPLVSEPVADAQVLFSRPDGALYTTCDVRAADRPGLLHAVAVAIASAGVDVHAAKVVTEEGVAHDRFDLSDRQGGPLDAALQDAVRARIVEGAAGPRGR
jgi:[protein-PII] uridylyltransferase